MVANRVYQSKAAASSNPTTAVLQDLSSRHEGEGEEVQAAGQRRPTLGGDRVCYYATGQPAQGFRACDPTAETSLCCPLGSACLGDDALCVVPTAGALDKDDILDGTVIPPVTTILQAACTDQYWDEDVCGRKDGQCPGQCNYPPQST